MTNHLTNAIAACLVALGYVHALAPRYAVSPKAIRDVWSGRTWAHVTARLARGCGPPPPRDSRAEKELWMLRRWVLCRYWRALLPILREQAVIRPRLRPSRLPHPIADAYIEGLWHFAAPIAFIIGVAVGVILAKAA